MGYTFENVVLAADCNVIQNSLLTYEEMLYLGPIIRSLIEKGQTHKNTRLTGIP